LRAVAMMLHDSLQEVAIGPNDFLGHLGQIVFLILVEPDVLGQLKDAVQRRMASSADYFYRIEDRQTEKFDGKKLAFRLGELAGAPTSFNDLDQLRKALLLLIKGA
jgi:hypothetical protein